MLSMHLLIVYDLTSLELLTIAAWKDIELIKFIYG